MSVALRKRRVTICRRTDKSTWPNQRVARQEIERLLELPHYAVADLDVYYCTVHKGYHIGNRP